MAVIRYHRYVGELWDDLDVDELVDELSDFFLESGFGREMEDWGGDDVYHLLCTCGRALASGCGNRAQAPYR